MNTVWLAFGLALLAVVAACAAPVANETGFPPAATEAGAAIAADTPIAMRLLVKLSRPPSDGAAIARAATAVAGVPVRYLAAAGAGWHALALHCASAPQCDGALRRLRSDTATYAAVERDERKRPGHR